MGDADAISKARHGSEVANDEHGVWRQLALAQQGNRAGGVVVAVDPFDSGGIIVEHMHGGLAALEAVELLHPRLLSTMNLILLLLPLGRRPGRTLAHLATVAPSPGKL